MQKDKYEFADHLYRGNNQPFTQIFTLLGQFRFPSNLTADENLNGTASEYDPEVSYDYYEDYVPWDSQVFLEKLVGQYPAEVKAGIRYLGSKYWKSKQKRYYALNMIQT